MRFRFAGLQTLLFVVFLQSAAYGQIDKQPVSVDLCQVVTSPATYDKLVLSMEGTLSPGEHYLLFFNAFCIPKAGFDVRILAELPRDLNSVPNGKKLSNILKSQKDSHVRLTGKFESSGGPFGPYAAPFRFSVTRIISAEKAPKPTFTMTISTAHETVAPGSKVIVAVHLTNVSDHALRFGRFGFGGPDLSYRVEVRNSQGQLAPYTEDYGKMLRREPPYNQPIVGGAAGYGVEKGETATETIEVTKQYDLSTSGKYTIRVFHSDLVANIDVQSTNTIILNVTQ
jgi:hypothetical protein